MGEQLFVFSGSSFLVRGEGTNYRAARAAGGPEGGVGVDGSGTHRQHGQEGGIRLTPFPGSHRERLLSSLPEGSWRLPPFSPGLVVKSTREIKAVVPFLIPQS